IGRPAGPSRPEPGPAGRPAGPAANANGAGGRGTGGAGRGEELDGATEDGDGDRECACAGATGPRGARSIGREVRIWKIHSSATKLTAITAMMLVRLTR